MDELEHEINATTDAITQVDPLRAKLSAWANDRLQECADQETRLLGNTKIVGWQMQLQYWLGRRDAMWALQRELKPDHVIGTIKKV